jgi:hypothetical protein
LWLAGLPLPVAWPPPVESAGLPPVLYSASTGGKGKGRAWAPRRGPCVGWPAARAASPARVATSRWAISAAAGPLVF